jgi:hypothetical protein
MSELRDHLQDLLTDVACEPECWAVRMGPDVGCTCLVGDLRQLITGRRETFPHQPGEEGDK